MIQLASIFLATFAASASVQAWGQPVPQVAPPNPRLPLGTVARQVITPRPPVRPGDPLAGPIRTLTYVITPDVRVRPSEVIVDPPEIHFVSPPAPRPLATDTAPR